MAGEDLVSGWWDWGACSALRKGLWGIEGLY